MDGHVEVGGKHYSIVRRLGGEANSPVLLVERDDCAYVAKVYGGDEPVEDARGAGAADDTMVAASVVESRFVGERAALDLLAKSESPRLPHLVHAGHEGELASSGGTLVVPILVLDYVEGKPLLHWVRELPPGDASSRIVSVLDQLAEAVEDVHRAELMHLDIKSANVLVDSDDQVHLIDFGLSKNISATRADDRTLLHLDPRLYPARLVDDFPELATGVATVTRLMLRRRVYPWLDLYQFGLLLQDMLSGIRSHLPTEDYDYLAHLSQQLRDLQATEDLGVQRVRVALERLRLSSAGRGIEELAEQSSLVRQISLPGAAIPLPPGIEAIVTTPGFRRLRYINQLSMISEIYPGADHKRSLHLFHAYYLARRLVNELSMTPLFRQLFGPEEQRQLLVSVLLHDVNHLPFLHTLQEANVPELTNYGLTDLFCGDDYATLLGARHRTIYECLATVGMSPEDFKSTLFGSRAAIKDPAKQAIRSVVDSGVDIDKLSYLYLDALFTGVNFGLGIDYPHIFRSTSLVDHPSKGVHLAFDIRAQSAVEHVINTRLLNFREIYWHHTNRAMMAMLLEVVRELFIDRNTHVHEYIGGTSFGSDQDAVRWLDREYQRLTGRASPLAHLVEDRGRLYRRLFTLRPEKDAIDDSMFEKIQALVASHGLVEAQKQIRQRMLPGLMSLLRAPTPPVQLHELLIDIPARKMDYGGETVMVRGDELTTLDLVSSSALAQKDAFDKLAKRVRLYVHPRLARHAEIDRGWRDRNMAAVRDLLRAAVEATLPDPGATAVS